MSDSWHSNPHLLHHRRMQDATDPVQRLATRMEGALEYEGRTFIWRDPSIRWPKHRYMLNTAIAITYDRSDFAPLKALPFDPRMLNYSRSVSSDGRFDQANEVYEVDLWGNRFWVYEHLLRFFDTSFDSYPGLVEQVLAGSPEFLKALDSAWGMGGSQAAFQLACEELGLTEEKRLNWPKKAQGPSF